MNKLILFFTVLFFSFSVVSQENFTKESLLNESKTISKLIKKRIKSSVEKDTFYTATKEQLKIINYYDHQKILLKTLKYSTTAEEKYQDCVDRNLNCKYLKKHGDVIEHFDDNGNKILMQIKDMDGQIWFTSINFYDSQNRLIQKRVSDIISTIKIEYKYDSENKEPSSIQFFDNRGNKIQPRPVY